MYVTRTPATGQPRSRVTNPLRTKITRLVNPDQVLQTGQKEKSSKFYNVAWPYSIHLEDEHYNWYCMSNLYVFGTPPGI